MIERIPEPAFERAVQFVLRHEGGYVNHPNDPGGETNFGISKRAYPDLDIKNLTWQQAVAIYRRDYWEAVRADEYGDYPLALAVFDTAVNMGVRSAVKLLQRVLGVASDGVIGPKTLAAVRAASVDTADRYCWERMTGYVEMALRRPKMLVFLKGWTNRMAGLAIEVAQWK